MARLASVVVTSFEGLPGYAGMRLVEDLGVVQRYEAVDGEGAPVSVLVLGVHASRDPQQRAAFVQQAMQASVAALPGQLPITFDDNPPRPWAASHQEQGAVGVERLLPRVLTEPAREGRSNLCPNLCPNRCYSPTRTTCRHPPRRRRRCSSRSPG